MTGDKNAPFNKSNDFEAPTQESSPETGPSTRLVEAFEHGLGDTANDVSDMRRLGKKQEFRVRRTVIPSLLCAGLKESYQSEEFWLSFNLGFHLHLHGYVGIRLGVCISHLRPSVKLLGHYLFGQIIECRTCQWRLWWPVLGLHWHCHLLFIYCRISSRNGVYVSRSLDKSYLYSQIPSDAPSSLQYPSFSPEIFVLMVQ